MWTRAGGTTPTLVSFSPGGTISCALKGRKRRKAPSMNALNWSDDRVEQLKLLWTEGLSASQIARALGGVTRNAVIGKVHRLGLAGRATPPRSDRPRLPSAPRVMRVHVPEPPVV